ncbi:MAG: hypothetical protein ABI083_11360 [Lapillicoccus sp.]
MTEQTGATETVRAKQGSQPNFNDVRVGIIRAGLKDGVPTAQLLLRSQEETQEVFLVEGEAVDLLGHGRLTVTGVHRGATPQDRTEVTLTWTA